MEDVTIEAFHFLQDDRNLQFPPHTRVEAGQTLRAEGPLSLCSNGLHASVRAIDALKYAPGGVICRVTLSGEIVAGDDKLCARDRTVLWMADATRTLHEFAVWCAETALQRERDAGREPDPRSWAALEIKRKWLNEEATDEELRTARAAARAAAGAAAWDAAGAAAWAAAWDAAWDAAGAAARAAAWDAAWVAAGAAQNTELERRLLLLAPTVVTA